MEGLNLPKSIEMIQDIEKALLFPLDLKLYKKNAQIIFDRIAGHGIDYQDVTYKVITIKDVIAIL